jgi:hypothetical protein
MEGKMKKPKEAQREVWKQAVQQLAEPRKVWKEAARQLAQLMLERSAFSGRGFRDRTVEALVAFGIYEPERLLFMSESQIKAIPGVGKASIAEIAAYRKRFRK